MTTFDHFWCIYPRRVAKRAALKAWEKEMRSGTTPEEIIEGLRRQLAHLSAKEAQFIPHPATWLNQGRWEDEVTEQPAQKTATKSAYRQYQDECAAELDKIINRDKPNDERTDNVIDLGTADYRRDRAARSGW